MRTALLIIDMFNTFKFVNGDKLRQETMEIITPILTLKKLARQKRFPILYINDSLYQQPISTEQFMKQFFHTNDHTFLSALKPEASDLFLLKEKFSAFFHTKLEQILQEKQIERLILTGIAGHICVLFTANDAYMRGYRLITPIDAYACGGEIQKCFTDEMLRRVFKSETKPVYQIIQDYT